MFTTLKPGHPARLYSGSSVFPAKVARVSKDELVVTSKAGEEAVFKKSLAQYAFVEKGAGGKLRPGGSLLSITNRRQRAEIQFPRDKVQPEKGKNPEV